MNPKQNPVTYVLKQSMQFKMNFKTHSDKQLLIFSVLIFTVCTTAYVRNIWRKPKKITEEECTLLPLTTPARYCSSSYHRFEFLIKKKQFHDLQSRRYAKLSTEAHKEAALQIVGEKNIRRDERTIDLHELRVIEALSYLESFITENIQGISLKHN